MITGLVLLLAAILAACAYLVLRYFGVVSGYGVSTDPSSGTYVLEDTLVAQGEALEFQVTDAYWQNSTLTVDLRICGEDSALAKNVDFSIEGLTELSYLSTCRMGNFSTNTAAGYTYVRMICTGSLPQETGDTLTLTLYCDGVSIPLTLLRADEETALDNAGFYSMTESDGGLLAIPRIEHGELVVSIYPLNEGEFSTYFFLNKGMWSSFGGPVQPITVTALDGTVLEGEPAPYSPFSGQTYLDWYFGPAEPGEYTLNVPYVYQYPTESREIYEELILTEGESEPGLSLDLPGGTLTLDRLTPTKRESSSYYTVNDVHEYSHSWTIDATWQSDDPERTLVAGPLRLKEETTIGYQTELEMQYTAETDPDTGGIWNRFSCYQLDTDLPLGAVTIGQDSKNLCYRWDHPFTIQMTVEAEPDWPSFTGAEDGQGVTATPRRANGQVVLSLESFSDQFTPYAGTTRASVPVALAEEPITLTAADGAVYEGSYQPGRANIYSGPTYSGPTYSDWSFGDIPAGEYTLHIPYLYFTMVEGGRFAVPLPGEEGESLPVGRVLLESGIGHLDLESITCLGHMAEMPAFSTDVLGQPDGHALSELTELPLQAELKFSLYPQDTEYEYTPLYAELYPGGYPPGSIVQPQYDENGLCGAVLNYAEGLYATEFAIRNVLIRWNHAFDIPVTIPE